MQFTPLSGKKASPKERFAEFLHDHRKPLLLLTLLAAVVAGCLIYLSVIEKPDVKVLFVSSRYVLPRESAENLEKLLAYHVYDLNEDGTAAAEVRVGFFNAEGRTDLDGEELAAQQALEQALENSGEYLVVIADAESYRYLLDAGKLADISSLDALRVLELEPDTYGLKVGDTRMFEYSPKGFMASYLKAYEKYIYDDYGMADFLADYYVAFRQTDADPAAQSYMSAELLVGQIASAK